jgi:hypothetical protein
MSLCGTETARTVVTALGQPSGEPYQHGRRGAPDITVLIGNHVEIPVAALILDAAVFLIAGIQDEGSPRKRATLSATNRTQAG